MTLAFSVLVGYSAAAWALGSFYPFSVFPMYAAAPSDRSVARLGVRTASGTVIEVTRFSAFQCDRPIDPDRFDEACREQGSAFSPRYLDDELAAHVRSHARQVQDGERIEIVRHVTRIAADGSASRSDCVLARCAALR